MQAQLIREVKVINYVNEKFFEEDMFKIFNDDTVRIVDTQFRTELKDSIIHYIAFIVYEYALPVDEEDIKHDDKESERRN